MNSPQISSDKNLFKNGFSVIELLVVVSAIVILGRAGVAFYSRFLVQNTVFQVTDRYTMSLRKAQTYAMMSKRNGSWGVRYGSNLITLFMGNSYATRVSAFDENYSVPQSISITGTTETVYIRSTGSANAIGTITIRGNSGAAQTIVINAQGVINR